MKPITLILLFFSLNFVHAQSLDAEKHEEMANFTSVLIDYEIHKDKIVAITKKNREYFMYYENEKGEKLFESIDIFFATDLEIDCMGNLFLVGVDSAIQLDISDHMTKVQSLDIDTYRFNISTCRALFDESLVRTSYNNSLIYEPIDDSVYANHPVLYTIQIWSNEYSRSFVRTNDPHWNTPKDATLKDNRLINIQNDQLSTSAPIRRTGRIIPSTKKYHVANELTAFQVGDSLWVFDKKNELLFVYDQYGKTSGLKNIDGLPVDFKLSQDRRAQDVYVLSNEGGGSRRIQKVDKNGELNEGVMFYKGFSRSSLKVSNGYLYFRDSKGPGETIKRVRLN